MSDDVLLTGLTPTDQILADGILLRGAVGEIGSDDPWIVGPNGTRYGLNTQGDLVIEDTAGDKTYVANYQGGPDLPFSQQTAGIFVGEAEVYTLRILDLLRPHIGTMMTAFKLGNELLYTRTGQTFFNSDPLVFDLSGTGVDLTALSDAAPMLDMRGDGFAVHTGWVGAGQGILVLQQAGGTATPTITEMLGGPGAEGFAALAQYDSNGDGVIDANDPIYSQLRIWVDGNHNGAVDAGELETLAQAGIASISLASTTQTGDTQAGNTITATGSFTRSDGSTGAVADVSFNVDTFHSTYLGDTTVSAAAAAMPNLKGYGTLTDLRVAMTLDPTLIDTVNANLPNLDVPDLAALRAAALPIFVAWAKAVKLPDASGNLQVVDPAAGHSDVAILLNTDPNGNVTVDDFGYQVTDAGGGELLKKLVQWVRRPCNSGRSRHSRFQLTHSRARLASRLLRSQAAACRTLHGGDEITRAEGATGALRGAQGRDRHAHRCARRSLSLSMRSQKRSTRSDSSATRTSASRPARWARAFDHARSSARILAPMRPVMSDNDWAAEFVVSP